MANLSQIRIGETLYDLKDAAARQQISEIISTISSGIHYRGVTTSELADGSTTNPITINEESYTAETGDLVIYGDLEFIFDGTTWHEFGSTGSLKALAFKDTASGTINASDSGHTHDVTYVKTGKTHSVTQGTVSASGNFTPAGTIGVGNGEANYTPGGTNAPSTVTLDGGSTAKLVTTEIKGVSGTETLHDTPTLNKSAIGSASGWDAGTMFSASVSGETLTFTAGTAPQLTVTETQVGTSLTAGTEKTVATADANVTTVATGSTSDSGTGATVATALHTGGTAAAQVFSGTGAELKFSGSQGSVSVSGSTSGVAVDDHSETNTNVTTGTGVANVTGTVTVS